MDIHHLIGVIIVFGLVFFAAFYQLSAILWTILIGVGLLVLSIFGYLSISVGLIFWFIFLFAATFANVPAWRKRYIIQPMLAKLKKQLPPISNTERIAIEAGNTWWEKELFCGRPHWKHLFAIPKPALSKEEEDFLNHQVEHLCSLLNDWKIVADLADLPPEVWAYLKKEKFLGIVIPKEYGGLGFSALAHSTIITKIATRSISAAVNTMVPNSLGPGELLVNYGTTEQKNYYLPRLASGEDIPCFALTAPNAGSDASSITDSGIICRDMFNGKEMIGIRLTWDKRYITLAPMATVLGLAVHLYDPDHLLSKNEDIGITLCLIPTSHPGVEIGHRHYPMQLAFMNGPTRGKDVFIPLDWIIGGPAMAGHGWKMVMEGLSVGRSISLPALSAATGKAIYRYTGAYARIRKQFNVPLSSFEGIQESLGFIAGYTYTLEACRMMTAGAVDLKIRPSIASAIAKYHTTELSRTIIAHAMDVHAGQMIQIGPRNFLAFVHYANPISITVEGANILTRNLIIFGQGAIRCHPYLLKEIELMSAPEMDTHALDQVLFSHIGFYLGNLLCNLAYGLTGGHLIFSFLKNHRVRRYHKQVTRMSAALALLADTSLILLGGSLKRRERISARLGDIMSQLYLASAVLKYYHDMDQPATDVDYVSWSVQECLRKIQIACNELFNNFPVPIVGKLLSWIIFPFGQAYYYPSDKLHESVVQGMLTPSGFRDRLTRYCYQASDPNEPQYRLDLAMSNSDSVDPVWKKLQKAIQSDEIPPYYDFAAQLARAQVIGVLNAEEARQLMEFDALKNEIIKVNEFSFDLKQIIA